MTCILDLPREIRDSIYDAIFQSQKPFRMIVPNYLSQSSRANTVFSVSYSQPDAAKTQDRDCHRPYSLRWLLANKQMCEEAIEQFQRKATWTIIDTVANGEGMEMRGRWANPTRRGRTQQAGPCLFMPSAARNIAVQKLLSVSTHLEVDDRGKPVWNIRADCNAENITPRLISELSSSRSLQTLSVSVRPWVIFRDTPPAELPCRVELDQLHLIQAPALRKMEFRVAYMDRQFVSCKDFVSALEGAFDKIGVELTGGNGVMAHDVNHDAGCRKSVYRYTRS